MYFPGCSEIPTEWNLLTQLVTVTSTAPRSGLIIIRSPQTANIMWENHFQLQETNCKCYMRRVMSQI